MGVAGREAEGGGGEGLVARSIHHSAGVQLEDVYVLTRRAANVHTPRPSRDTLIPLMKVVRL